MTSHPHTLIVFITVSSPPVSWCVVGVLAQYGCRRIIQVDAAHWWWMRRYPPYYVKRFEYPEKHYINVTNYYYLLSLLLYFSSNPPKPGLFKSNQQTRMFQSPKPEGFLRWPWQNTGFSHTLWQCCQQQLMRKQTDDTKKNHNLHRYYRLARGVYSCGCYITECSHSSGKSWNWWVLFTDELFYRRNPQNKFVTDRKKTCFSQPSCFHQGKEWTLRQWTEVIYSSAHETHP